MARITFKKGDAYAIKLSKLGEQSEQIARQAVYAGANVVADKIRGNLNGLPTENFRHLESGDMFDGVPEHVHKQDLQSSFGVSRIDRDADGIINAKIGFDGYGRKPTKKYPQGLPNQLLARAIESGSSVRKKHPFVRPAVNATRKMAVSEMAKVVDEQIEAIVGRMKNS